MHEFCPKVDDTATAAASSPGALMINCVREILLRVQREMSCEAGGISRTQLGIKAPGDEAGYCSIYLISFVTLINI